MTPAELTAGIPFFPVFGSELFTDCSLDPKRGAEAMAAAVRSRHDISCSVDRCTSAARRRRLLGVTAPCVRGVNGRHDRRDP
jgi:hypothetical protein